MILVATLIALVVSYPLILDGTDMCANRGWAASIWVNRLMSGSRRKSVMFGMSS